MPRFRDEYDDDTAEEPLLPHRGTLILVLGILSIVSCHLLGPFAWWMGREDLRKIRSGEMDPSGESSTYTGMICGMVMTILTGIGLAIALVFLLGMAVFAGAAAN